jgi:methionyl-tRNA synthetase
MAKRRVCGLTYWVWSGNNFLRSTASAIFKEEDQSRKWGRGMISIDEFRKIELKVATIKSAEPHPNADKLMVLQVDLGSEQRQICAGIRNQYAPEELIGKQIVIVANLETAKLRGLESQGMLLAASDEARVILLMPEKSVPPGSKVS